MVPADNEYRAPLNFVERRPQHLIARGHKSGKNHNFISSDIVYHGREYSRP